MSDHRPPTPSIFVVDEDAPTEGQSGSVNIDTSVDWRTKYFHPVVLNLEPQTHLGPPTEERVGSLHFSRSQSISDDPFSSTHVASDDHWRCYPILASHDGGVWTISTTNAHNATSAIATWDQDVMAVSFAGMPYAGTREMYFGVLQVQYSPAIASTAVNRSRLSQLLQEMQSRLPAAPQISR